MLFCLGSTLVLSWLDGGVHQSCPGQGDTPVLSWKGGIPQSCPDHGVPLSWVLQQEPGYPPARTEVPAPLERTCDQRDLGLGLGYPPCGKHYLPHPSIAGGNKIELCITIETCEVHRLFVQTSIYILSQTTIVKLKSETCETFA